MLPWNWVYIEKGNDNKIDNCVFRNLGSLEFVLEKE
jgi:hypothetical protein